MPRRALGVVAEAYGCRREQLVLDEIRWTPSGVRMRAVRRNPGRLSWLFLPGGPGIGSDSLAELVEAVDVPGTSWLVDLPGDGSNVDAPGAPHDPFALWPRVLLEAAIAVPDPVCVGHSTGGEYLLSVAELESELRGLVLISTAPHAGWMGSFAAMTEQFPIPAVVEATRRYERDPGPDTLRDLAVASAPWNFTGDGLPRGRELLGRMPYNTAAVDWSDTHFDHTYVSAWWPESVPTLIVSGAADRVVDQQLWNDARFRGDHVVHRTIPQAAHFPWIEQPDAVRAAFQELTELMNRPASPATRARN